MYAPKFDYQPISRATVDGKRLYTTPGGKLPSVTTILSATKSAESTRALNQWRQRVGVNEAQKITNESANVGTLFHDNIERYLRDEPLEEKDNIIHRMAREMADTVVVKGLVNLDEVWGIECPLYFPGLYAGTTDLVGIYKGRPAIIDYKNTRKPKKDSYLDEYKCQLVAYALAHNELYGTDINQGVILMVAREEPFYLTFQEFVIEGAEFTKWRDEWLKKVEQYYGLPAAA